MYPNELSRGIRRGCDYCLQESLTTKSKAVNYSGAPQFKAMQLRSTGLAIVMKAERERSRASLQQIIGMKRQQNRTMWMLNINWVIVIVSVEARRSICRLHWNGTKKQPGMVTQMP